MEKNLVEIDGSELEGGGQILRISTSLSAILKVPIRVTKIRAGRSKGGLRPQHLTGLELIRDISNGKLTGGKIDSFEITFVPGSVDGGTFFADTKTAGSVCLLMQSLLPCALYSKSECIFTLRGGTNADMAPPIDYYIEIFQRICMKFGIDFEVILNKRGFFPRGQGEVTFSVKPVKRSIQPIELIEQGKVISIEGYSFAAGTLPIRMAHLMADGAEKVLRNHFGREVNIKLERYKELCSKAVGNGCFIMLWAVTSTGCILASSCIGKREIAPEDAGKQVATELLEDIESGSCLDRHAQDQVILLMALACRTSKIRISKPTLHTQTAIHVVEALTRAKFDVKEDPSGKTVIVECYGIGHTV